MEVISTSFWFFFLWIKKRKTPQLIRIAQIFSKVLNFFSLTDPSSETPWIFFCCSRRLDMSLNFFLWRRSSQQVWIFIIGGRCLNKALNFSLRWRSSQQGSEFFFFGGGRPNKALNFYFSGGQLRKALNFFLWLQAPQQGSEFFSFADPSLKTPSIWFCGSRCLDKPKSKVDGRKSPLFSRFTLLKIIFCSPS